MGEMRKACFKPAVLHFMLEGCLLLQSVAGGGRHNLSQGCHPAIVRSRVPNRESETGQRNDSIFLMLYNLHTTLRPQRRRSFSRFATLGSVLRAAFISQTIPDILHVAFHAFSGETRASEGRRSRA